MSSGLSLRDGGVVEATWKAAQAIEGQGGA